MDEVGCAVVGAGPAGLAVSAALTGLGIEHVVLERGRVGHTWRTQRWDSFRLNTPGHMNAVLGPDQPVDHYAWLPEVLTRLEAVAAAAPVREGVRVRRLSPTGQGFTLGTSQGDVRTRTVVVATGDQNVPRLPRLAQQLPGAIAQRHTSGYRNADDLPTGAVLVVGSGQSGCQIADDLRRHGREVWLATSAVGRMPARHRGSATISALVEAGFFDQRPEDLPDPAMLRAAQPVIGAGGHNLSLQSLARDGVHLLGRPTTIAGTLLAFDHSLRSNVAAADAFAARLRDFLEAARLRTDAAGGAPARTDADRTDADRTAADWAAEDGTAGPVDLDAPDQLDLGGQGITSVVWATGFTGDFSWLLPQLIDERGALRHRGVASALPGVWFAGMKWLVNRSSGILRGMPRDAATIAEAVAGALSTSHPRTPA